MHPYWWNNGDYKNPNCVITVYDPDKLYALRRYECFDRYQM